VSQVDCVIIGGGPGGYVAAIRARQLGLTTVLVEKQHMGGQCLNWGCIPSKSLMESAKLFQRVRDAKNFGIDGVDAKALSFNWDKAIKRKDRIVSKLVRGVEFLMKKNGVEVVTGEATIDGKRVIVGDRVLEAGNILLATGATPPSRAFDALDREHVLSIPEFYALGAMPDSVLVYGGNGAACETATMLALTGTRVTMAFPGDRLLDFIDGELSDFVAKRMKKLKVTLLSGVDSLGYRDGVFMAGDTAVEAGFVLNCSDRRAVIPSITGPSPELDERGFIRVDEHGATSVKGFYAAGDVTGLLWAQAASAQGTAAVSHMAGSPQPVDLDKIPVNLYLDPEIASVGMTEEELQAQNVSYRKGDFSLAVNGKALAEGNTEGFVKVLATEPYGEVVGVHVVAADATDLISEAVAHMKLEATLEDVTAVIHAHPTLSEAFWEASFDALERPLHK
jgi:dihydrolipoamide dehydrogenase